MYARLMQLDQDFGVVTCQPFQFSFQQLPLVGVPSSSYVKSEREDAVQPFVPFLVNVKVETYL